MSADRLATVLMDYRSIRLVILNSCEGARPSSTDPFAGTAQTLIRAGIPAVIAMQFEVTDDAAIAFSTELYASVAVGDPIDRSLAEARRMIFFEGNDVEWATPVLYLRSVDTRIFAVPQTTAVAEQRAQNEANRSGGATQLSAEEGRAEEAARAAEEKRKAEEATRAAEEKRKAEEAARQAEEKRRAEQTSALPRPQRLTPLSKMLLIGIAVALVPQLILLMVRGDWQYMHWHWPDYYEMIPGALIPAVITPLAIASRKPSVIAAFIGLFTLVVVIFLILLLFWDGMDTFPFTLSLSCGAGLFFLVLAHGSRTGPF